jgi:transcriptional repressor NrdR
LNCERRFTTYERIEYVSITVLKSNGDRESFDRSKVFRGMLRACEKTGVTASQLETLVDEIEAELQQRARREIESQEIGTLVLKYLRTVSEVAYVRFASVYQKFQGIQDFADALNQMSKAEQEAVAQERLGAVAL